jgi:hypothetical protein
MTRKGVLDQNPRNLGLITDIDLLVSNFGWRCGARKENKPNGLLIRSEGPTMAMCQKFGIFLVLLCGRSLPAFKFNGWK